MSGDPLRTLRGECYHAGVLALSVALYRPEEGARLLGHVDPSKFADEALSYAWGCLTDLRSRNAAAGLASLQTQNVDQRLVADVRALREEVVAGGTPDAMEYLQGALAKLAIAEQLNRSLNALTRVDSSGPALTEAWGVLAYRAQEALAEAAPPPARLTVAEMAIAELDRQASGWQATYGIPLIDSRSGGLQPGTVHVVIGGTGAGKSSLAMTAALNTAQRGLKVLYVTKEMLAEHCSLRFASMVTGKAKWELTKARRSGQMGEELLDRLIPDGIEIRDNLLSVPHIAAEVQRAEISGEPYHLVCIDYLQQYKGVGESEVQRLDIAVEQIKSMALQRNVAVVTPAQLNREAGIEDVPNLNHIRGSGAIEQWADVVVALRNTRSYLDDESQYAVGDLEKATAFEMHAAIRKAREGQVGPLWGDASAAEFGSLKMGRGTYRFWESKWSPWHQGDEAKQQRAVESSGFHSEPIE